jgi:hypothetical protein
MDGYDQRCPICRDKFIGFKNDKMVEFGLECLKFMNDSDIWNEAYSQQEEFSSFFSQFLQG